MAGYRVAVDPLCFFAEPLDIGSAVRHLSPGLGDRLTVLGRQDDGEVFVCLYDQIEELPHDTGAVFPRTLRPLRLSDLGLVDRVLDVVEASVGQRCQHFAIGRVFDIETFAGRAFVFPLAATKHILTDQ